MATAKIRIGKLASPRTGYPNSAPLVYIGKTLKSLKPKDTTGAGEYVQTLADVDYVAEDGDVATIEALSGGGELWFRVVRDGTHVTATTYSHVAEGEKEYAEFEAGDKISVMTPA